MYQHFVRLLSREYSPLTPKPVCIELQANRSILFKSLNTQKRSELRAPSETRRIVRDKKQSLLPGEDVSEH